MVDLQGGDRVIGPPQILNDVRVLEQMEVVSGLVVVVRIPEKLVQIRVVRVPRNSTVLLVDHASDLGKVKVSPVGVPDIVQGVAVEMVPIGDILIHEIQVPAKGRSLDPEKCLRPRRFVFELGEPIRSNRTHIRFHEEHVLRSVEKVVVVVVFDDSSVAVVVVVEESFEHESGTVHVTVDSGGNVQGPVQGRGVEAGPDRTGKLRVGTQHVALESLSLRQGFHLVIARDEKRPHRSRPIPPWMMCALRVRLLSFGGYGTRQVGFKELEIFLHFVLLGGKVRDHNVREMLPVIIVSTAVQIIAGWFRRQRNIRCFGRRNVTRKIHNVHERAKNQDHKYDGNARVLAGTNQL